MPATGFQITCNFDVILQRWLHPQTCVPWTTRVSWTWWWNVLTFSPPYQSITSCNVDDAHSYSYCCSHSYSHNCSSSRSSSLQSHHDYGDNTGYDEALMAPTTLPSPPDIDSKSLSSKNSTPSMAPLFKDDWILETPSPKWMWSWLDQCTLPQITYGLLFQYRILHLKIIPLSNALILTIMIVLKETNKNWRNS